MYAKYSQKPSRKTTHGKRTGNKDGGGDTSDQEEGGSLNAPTSGGNPRLRQEESSRLIKIEKDIVKLMTVFDDTAVVPRNVTNRCLIGSFQ